jgi:ATP-binding cassette, subfamily B (MDR/TAP), member 1
VTFSYPTNSTQLALQDVSLFFPAGEISFVIGTSGSGKSTIGQLLVGLYPASQGVICIDGLDIPSLGTEWLRSNITLVEQESVLFTGTIFENIAIGNSKSHRKVIQYVRQAAEFSLLHQTINDLPEGWNTLVGTNGTSCELFSIFKL